MNRDVAMEGTQEEQTTRSVSSRGSQALPLLGTAQTAGQGRHEPLTFKYESCPPPDQRRKVNGQTRFKDSALVYVSFFSPFFLILMNEREAGTALEVRWNCATRRCYPCFCGI